MSKRLLLVAVDRELRAAFERRCAREGVSCTALEGHEAPASPATPFSLCVVASLSDPDAVAVVRGLRKVLAGCPVVVLADALSTDVVVQLVRSGAADVVGLPLSPETVVARAWSSLPCTDPGEAAADLVGSSAVFRAVLDEVRSVAAVRSTVLVSGETGTGKGLVARAVHRLSHRADRPFVHVDCSSLAESVVESELFGHQRGSFTGAVETRPGRFEVAADGTIFLDEIGELGPNLQVKLLRVLENREFERVGSTRTQAMNARVIAATNRDLRALVEQGRFRADLYFRLEVFHLHVPPLRDRLEDVPALVQAGLARLAQRLDVPVPAVTEAFCARLREHAWPGNVRELMNVLERALVRARGPVLDADALDGARLAPCAAPAVQRTEPADDARAPLPASEGDCDRETVEAVLSAVGGNISRAARRLGVARSTLRYRVRQLGLDALIPKD
jgi:DNA-binding NtrC family response regulator